MLRKLSRSRFSGIARTTALCIALATGGASAATTYLVSSNADVAPDVVAGHHPPTGDHANVIAGSLTSEDLMPQSIGAAQLAPPDPWHSVAPAPRNGTYPCNHGTTGVFCEYTLYSSTGTNTVSHLWWDNAGGSFAPAAYAKDLDGVIRLRGVVSVNADGGCCYMRFPIFLLPAAYRPAHELMFATVDNDSISTYAARIDIEPDGRVLPWADQHGSTGKLLALDGIAFRAGQ